MSKPVTLEGAAGVAAAMTIAAAAVLAFHTGSPIPALAVAPLIVGLVAMSLRQTWGVFATLGGAGLVYVAYGLGELPLFGALIATGALAVAIPMLVRAFRFDAAAAAVWMTMAATSGAGAALAWNELDLEPEAPIAEAPAREAHEVTVRAATPAPAAKPRPTWWTFRFRGGDQPRGPRCSRHGCR